MKRDDRSAVAMKRLLIIVHSRTGGARQMAEAALRGASSEPDAEARLLEATQAVATDLLEADAYVFAGPENLAGLSGALKEFFDRTYYDLLGRIEGRRYALLICAGTDGTGALRQAERILTGWRLRPFAPPLVVRTGADSPETILAPKRLPSDALEACEGLGAGFAAALAAGVA